MSDRLCQVRAQWRVSGLERYTPRPDLDSRKYRATGSDAPRTWTPPPPVAFDDETVRALEAHAAGAPAIVRVAGVDIGQQVPLLLAHDENAEPLIPELEIAVTGDLFTAQGWVDERYAETIDRLRYVSDTIRPRKARLVELPGETFVHVTESVLIELSLTDTPGREGTSVFVASPGRTVWPRPTGERFTRVSPAPPRGPEPEPPAGAVVGGPDGR